MNPRNDDNPKLPQPDEERQWLDEYKQWAEEMERMEGDRDDDTH